VGKESDSKKKKGDGKQLIKSTLLWKGKEKSGRLKYRHQERTSCIGRRKDGSSLGKPFRATEIYRGVEEPGESKI